jgi:transcriptional regulator with XRE-family HTH domain
LKVDPSKAGQDRQDLAAALRDLRKASGLSGERLAVRCGMSQSKVSRIETGRILPSVIDVQQILDALHVNGEVREELLQLASAANAEYEDVRSSVRRGLHHRQRELAALESTATHTRYFLPAMLTGLLQTPEYMRVAMRPSVDPATVDVSNAISLKLERQSVLHDGGKHFEFLITETAARWRITGPSAMALQLDRLISLSRLPNIRLSVLPLSAQVADPAFHTFTVYDEKLVTVELFTGRLMLRDRKDVDHYRALFDFFSARASFGDSARALLSDWSEQFRHEA